MRGLTASVRISDYLPSLVRRHLEKALRRQEEGGPALPLPDTHEIQTVCVFADVSGFTAMSESLAARGPTGAEFLGKYLNSYFSQMVRHISSAGGDVFKFAGDAMIIFWPENQDDTYESLIRRAVQCALSIQDHLHKAELAPGVVLSVKMGVGVGRATIADLGGVSDGDVPRVEYIATGPAVLQAFEGEGYAKSGEVVCAPEAWELVSEYFTGEKIQSAGDFIRVKRVDKQLKRCSRRTSDVRDDFKLQARMWQYVPRAVVPFLDADEESWGSELRQITCLFINLGFTEQDLVGMLDNKGLQKLQNAFALVQRAVYDYEGTINKFLVDDKGSTVIAVFGLPPVAHENDATRGVLAALSLCSKLFQIGLAASVGITSGVAFCGVVGHHGNRREYTVLGDIVNLSARLMQRAKQQKGGILTDLSTRTAVADTLQFEEMSDITVKGKTERVLIYRPYPKMSALMQYRLEAANLGGKTYLHRKRTSPQLLSQGLGRGIKTQRSLGGTIMIFRESSSVSIGRQDSSSSVLSDSSEQTLQSQVVNTMADILEIQLITAEERRTEPIAKACKAAAEHRICLQHSLSNTSVVTVDELNAVNQEIERQALLRKEGLLPVITATVSTEGRTLTRIRQSLIDKCRLVIEKGIGGGFLLEGDIGLGKTRLLCTALCNTDLAFATFMVGCGNPYEQGTGVRRYGVWLQLLAEKMQSLGPGVEEKTSKIQKILESTSIGSLLLPYASRVNNLLGTNFKRSEAAGSGVPDEIKGVLGTKEIEFVFEGTDPEDSLATPSSNLNALRSMESGDETLASCPEAENEQPELTVAAEKLPQSEKREEEPEKPELAKADASERKEELGTPFVHREKEKPGQHDEDHHEENNQAEEDIPPVSMEPIKIDLTGLLILTILQGFAKEGPLILVIDDASFIDKKSWQLALRTAQDEKNILVIVATRPPRKVSDRASGQLREILSLFRSFSRSETVVLEPLAPLRAEALARQELGVQELPAELTSVLIQRSQGNPLFLIYLVRSMKDDGLIVLEKENGTMKCTFKVQRAWGDKSEAACCYKCHLSFQGSYEKHKCRACGYTFCESCTPDACKKMLPGENEYVRHCVDCFNNTRPRRVSGEKGQHQQHLGALLLGGLTSTDKSKSATKNIGLKPPVVVNGVITAWVDELSVCQRMLLKTATLLGPSFELELLKTVYPISAHGAKLDEEFQGLLKLNFIKRVELCAGSTASIHQLGGRVKYEITHGFLHDVLRCQMLSIQQEKLNKRIDEYRERQDRELRQQFFIKTRMSMAMKTEGVSQSKVSPMLRLKGGLVAVRKQASVFSAISKAPLWKKRWAVLQNSRLIFQHDENENQSQTLGKCTILNLAGANVEPVPAETAGRPFCFKIEVKSWSRDKIACQDVRSFLVSVRSHEEMSSWVYLIKYAIEACNEKFIGGVASTDAQVPGRQRKSAIGIPALRSMGSALLPRRQQSEVLRKEV